MAGLGLNVCAAAPSSSRSRSRSRDSFRVCDRTSHRLSKRNLVLKQELQKGNRVRFRCIDDLLSPILNNGDICLLEPVVNRSTLQVDDIVFCQTGGDEDEGGGKFLLQKISAMTKLEAESAPRTGDESAASAPRVGDADVNLLWEIYALRDKDDHFVDICYGKNIYGRIERVYNSDGSLKSCSR